MSTVKHGQDAVEQTIKQAGRLLIASHINPDGDAVGSVAALAAIALDLGKEARIYLQSGVPRHLDWLPLPAPRVRTLADLGNWEPDCIIFVDCGDGSRAGDELTPFLPGPARLHGGPITVNIDHHISNPGFAAINWVEPRCSATGEMVGRLAEGLGIPLCGALGEALYLALVSDTGNFSYANTGADCLALASRIAAQGLDIGRFTQRHENNWSLARMHLWGRLMSEITLHENGAIVCSVVPLAYLKEAGLGKDALEGYASWLRKLRGVRVALFVREDGPGSCKISLRSMGDVDTQRVAAAFGGGGHKAASGADLSLPPGEAAARVLEALRPALEPATEPCGAACPNAAPAVAQSAPGDRATTCAAC